jgi:hypothetical protein
MYNLVQQSYSDKKTFFFSYLVEDMKRVIENKFRLNEILWEEYMTKIDIVFISCTPVHCFFLLLILTN